MGSRVPSHNPYAVLIADPEMSDSQGFSEIPITFAHTGPAAETALKNPTNNFAAVFVHPAISYPGSLRLIAATHRFRPATPVFLLHEGGSPFSPQELRRLAICETVQKPLTQEVILDKVARAAFTFRAVRGSQPSLFIREEGSYLKVPAADFLSGAPSIFDIHMRLPSGNFLKVVDASDPFPAHRVLSYIQKGAEYFYLSKESHERCLSYCELVIKQLLSLANVAPEIKFYEVANYGQAIYALIHESGLGQEQMDAVSTFIQDTHILVEQLKLSEVHEVRSFLSRLHAYEHAIGTTMIAALLSSHFRLDSERAFTGLGVSSFLHDVGLHSMPVHLQKEEIELMTADQLDLYRTHPQRSAEIVERASEGLGLEESAIQAIRLHHMRRNHLGFPKKGAGETPIQAEIVGISDEFVRLVMKAKLNPNMNALAEMESDGFNGFSYPVIEGFQKTFIRKS